MSSSESASGVGISRRATMAPRGRRLQAFASGPCYHRSMTTFIGPDDTIDFAKSSRQRSQDHVACFLHLRDLVYLHPEAASASAVSVVQTLEARVIAAKAAREKGSGETRADEIWRIDGRPSPQWRRQAAH